MLLTLALYVGVVPTRPSSCGNPETVMSWIPLADSFDIDQSGDQHVSVPSGPAATSPVQMAASMGVSGGREPHQGWRRVSGCEQAVAKCNGCARVGLLLMGSLAHAFPVRSVAACPGPRCAAVRVKATASHSHLSVSRLEAPSSRCAIESAG